MLSAGQAGFGPCSLARLGPQFTYTQWYSMLSTLIPRRPLVRLVSASLNTGNGPSFTYGESSVGTCYCNKITTNATATSKVDHKQHVPTGSGQ